MKKMNNNGLSRAIALILVVVVALGVSIMPDFNTKQTSAAAKKHNGKEVAGSSFDNLMDTPNGVASKNKKLIKKLKKNAWSENANPASEMISQGYALYKIYNVFVDSGYLDTIEFEEDSLSKLTLAEVGYSKIVASSKAQKKAINWMLTHDVYSGSDTSKGVFDGKRKITRCELVQMFQGIIRRYYPMMLEDIYTSTSWLKAEGYSSDSTPHIPMMKGIIVGEYLDLDDYATKEDLSRALKNFKLVIKNRIKPIYRDKEVTVTKALIGSEIEELTEFFKNEYGANISVAGGNSVGINLPAVTGYLSIDTNGKSYCYSVQIGFNGDNQDRKQCWYVRGAKIDIVETVKKMFKIRYWKE